MQSNFSNKGTVSTLGTVIVECDQRTRKLVKLMRFYNASVHQIDIDVYDAYSNTTVRMTSMLLNGGDHLREEDEIYLEPGDKITVTCDIPGTTFFVTGEDIDLKKR
jgi:archaellum component FlaF (FlaF/FlaG flagellin family)